MKIRDLIENITWESLNTFSLDDKFFVFEQAHSYNDGPLDLFENNESTTIFFDSLLSASDTPVVGSQMIVVPLSFINDRPVLLDSNLAGRKAKIISASTSTNEITVEVERRTKTFPYGVFREKGLYYMFTFSSIERYNTFKSLLIMKFGSVNLPEGINADTEYENT